MKQREEEMKQRADMCWGLAFEEVKNIYPFGFFIAILHPNLVRRKAIEIANLFDKYIWRN